jgi:hypothetical protein
LGSVIYSPNSFFKMRIRILLFWLLLGTTMFAKGKDFVLVSHEKAYPIFLSNASQSPVKQAAKLLATDISAVTNCTPLVLDNLSTLKKNTFAVVSGIPGTNVAFDRILKKHKIATDSLKGAWETYRLQVVPNGKGSLLLVIGSDALGSAYGLLELSRQIGVSPWVWWADAAPVRKQNIIFSAGFCKEDKPSVQYRGIFLNDEDFSLMPWATQTLSPSSAKGAIGPKAYERIFQLLLRLRANVIWPAMHGCTVPFYAVPGNAEMAAKYGIYVATSHCEPLNRNNVGEWNEATMGDYDYTTNAEKVRNYWKERVVETVNTPCVYTVGMRGIHDGKMQGANSLEEQKDLLEKVFVDQRQILTDGLKKPIGSIPQVFIPYKEVLDVYDAGLIVPDDITLMWCDDNYGNITRLSNPEEQKRSGGSGVYYHLSYWGRPHDYLWLATTSPAQIQFEMMRAWDHQARKIWLVNVGDIKPAEYLTEYFLDLAWNAGKKVEPMLASVQDPLYVDHLLAFLQREFGADHARTLSHILQTYYQLANQRKPEFMGWSRVEESKYPGGKSPVVDTEFSQEEAGTRIQAYVGIERQVRSINEKLTGEQRTSFFQLVLYPVVGASLLNQKLLYAQLSRQAEAANLPMKAEVYAAASLFAYQEIKHLTTLYNDPIANGKWALFMNDHPRDLNVFKEPQLPERLKNVVPKSLLHTSVVLRSSTAPSKNLHEKEGRVSFPASVARPENRPSGLGHSYSAIWLKKGETLEYRFTTTSTGDAELCICTLPNFAVNGSVLRYEIALNENTPISVNTQTEGRSEAWKLRVLRNQSVIRIECGNLQPGLQTLKIKALDDDVLVDQIMLDFDPSRKMYLMPGTPLVF